MSEKLLNRKSELEAKLCDIGNQIAEIRKSIPLSVQANCKRLKKLRAEQNSLTQELNKLKRHLRLKEAIAAATTNRTYYRARYSPTTYRQ